MRFDHKGYYVGGILCIKSLKTKLKDKTKNQEQDQILVIFTGLPKVKRLLTRMALKSFSEGHTWP